MRKDEHLKHFPRDLPLGPKTQHFYILPLGSKDNYHHTHIRKCKK